MIAISDRQSKKITLGPISKLTQKIFSWQSLDNATQPTPAANDFFQGKQQAEQRRLWETFQTYSDEQKQATKEYVQKHGVPNYLPTKESIDDNQYTEIAKAFSPVAVACLQGKLSQEHQLAVLVYADTCVEDDESKLPILYQFLRFCLSLRIFTEEFILESKLISTRIKKAIAIRKIHHLSKASLPDDSNDKRHDLKKAIIHQLTPENTASTYRQSMSSLAINWLTLEDSSLQTLGTFCKAWSNGKIARLIAKLNEATGQEEPQISENKSNDLATAKYLAIVSDLPKPVINVLRQVSNAIQKKLNPIKLDTKNIDIKKLNPDQQEALVKTFLYFEQTIAQMKESTPSESPNVYEEKYQTDAFSTLIAKDSQTAFSEMLKGLYKTYLLELIESHLFKGYPLKEENLPLKKLGELLSPTEAQKLTTPIIARACLHIWKQDVASEASIDITLESLRLLLNIDPPYGTRRENVLTTLLQNLDSADNYLHEFTEVVFEILASNIPEKDQEKTETHNLKNILTDLNLLLQLNENDNKHPQLPDQLLNAKEVQHTGKTILESWKDYLTKNDELRQSLLQDEKNTETTKNWLSKPVASDHTSVFNTSVTAFGKTPNTAIHENSNSVNTNDHVITPSV